jgi:hypothetical protein
MVVQIKKRVDVSVMKQNINMLISVLLIYVFTYLVILVFIAKLVHAVWK